LPKWVAFAESDLTQSKAGNKKGTNMDISDVSLLKKPQENPSNDNGDN
jgi:hypothetical protein